MRTRRLMVVGLALVVFAGCKKKQSDPPTSPKPQPAAASAASASAPTPSPGALSASSGEANPANPSAKPSEQQERALRRFNENTWFIQQAIQIAPADEMLTAGISKMLKAATPDWDHANPSHWEIRGPEIAARLRPWLAMAQTLEARKQAAALLIADRIVVIEEEDGNLEPPDNERPPTAGQTPVNLPKSSAQFELEKLGARFTYDDGSERYFYDLNWLQKAYELDPKGQAGDLAFVALMRRGFDTSRTCANGSEQFREVIRRGSEFLREHHTGDVEAQVHFTMGDAYRDIVALAEGLQGDNYVDANTYKPEAPAARTKAIAEYHAGLALDDKSDASLAAKDQLRSLEAGEAPHYARFYCQMMD